MGRRAVLIAITAAAVAGGAAALGRSLRASLETPADFHRTGYARSESCLPCHPGRHASWRRTYHRTMTQEAGPLAVLGDFDDARYAFDGVESRFTREGGRYFVETLGPDGRPGRFAVAMTVGSRRFQQY